MPTFSIRSFRRRSSSRNGNGAVGSEDTSSGSSQGSRLPASKSSSTLNSFMGAGSRTPSSQLGSSESSNSSTIAPITRNGTSTSLANQAVRPVLDTRSKRQSVAGMSGLGSPDSDNLPVSQYAPVVTSTMSGAAVYTRNILISGIIGDVSSGPVDGNITITHFDDSYPPCQWPVADSTFKAIIPLNAGKNCVRLSFTSPKLSNVTSNNIHTSNFILHYVPQTQSPPLNLVILLGKDSPGTFDAPPARAEREGNDLDMAIKKYRMAAYLWQAYTHEQMNRSRLGRRTFRFDEEWTSGTISSRDQTIGAMRSEARVHIIRSQKTVAEIRDADVAQQNPNAKRAGDLFSWAMEDVKHYFNARNGQKQYCAVLYLDSHWDKQMNMLLGHAALGGGDDQMGLAIFGSQALHSYPSCIEEVVSAFTDCTRTDTNFVANDCAESGSNWEAANIGIGAHMHEVGHLFGCPHQESGIMLRDYVTLNRSFVAKEAYSTRTGSKGMFCNQDSECNWHRLDLLRMRIHPCFKVPGDAVLHKDPSVEIWPVETGLFLVAPSGVAYMEIFVEGDEMARGWMEFGDGLSRGQIQRQYFVTDADVRARLPEHMRKQNVRVQAKSFGNGNAESSVISADKSRIVKMPNQGITIAGSKRLGFLGHKHGLSQTQGSEKQQIIFESVLAQKSVMTAVVAYSGFALNGLEFCYEDGNTQVFGVKSGNAARFNLDLRRGEIISGFNIRAGVWIDGIQILTSTGRTSEMFGASALGSGANIMPPRGYTIVGISGSAGQWMDGFQVIISR